MSSENLWFPPKLYTANITGVKALTEIEARPGVGDHIVLDKVHCSILVAEAGKSVQLEAGLPAPVFVGAGLDDLTNSGKFTGIIERDFVVKIDAEGTPDTFTWSKDGGATWDAAGVAITGAAQTLTEGVKVTFAATTGHTDTEYWTFKAEVLFLPKIPMDLTDVHQYDLGEHGLRLGSDRALKWQQSAAGAGEASLQVQYHILEAAV